MTDNQASHQSATETQARAPSVHALTSPVALNLTANVLLACGYEPSLSDDPASVSSFVATSDALVINLGMLDERRQKTSLIAAESVSVPWVLDPVMCHRSPQRLAVAVEIAKFRPTVIRGNAAEIDALIAACPNIAHHSIIARTGAVDVVSSPDGRSRAIAGGHMFMDRITAMGCAGTTIVAGRLAFAGDSFDACCQALTFLKQAGELAGLRAAGPGSFQMHYLDALHQLTHQIQKAA